MWVLSLLRKLASNSAVLTSAGSSFHRRGARTEKSWDLAAERCLPVLSEGEWQVNGIPQQQAYGTCIRDRLASHQGPP